MTRLRKAGRRIDPIARFMQEHDLALTQLSALTNAARFIMDRGYSPDAFRRVQAALAYIEDEVSIHNRREEEALFPVLERYVEGPTKIMREEHKELRKEYRRLRRAVTRVGKNTVSKQAALELVTAARGLVQLLVNHIHKENHILFPLVQKFLTKDALREVARRML